MLKQTNNYKNGCRLLYICLASLFFAQCSDKSKVESVISSHWAIDSIYYNSQDFRICMLGNTLSFFETCTTPEIPDFCDIKYIPEADNSWKIIKRENHYYLNLNVTNNLFRREYMIYFEDDIKNKLLKMRLVHDNGYIVCSKVLFNHDANQSLINELVKVNR